MTIDELIEALESASEGSRELDALVWTQVCTLPDFGYPRDALADGYEPKFEPEQNGSVNCYAYCAPDSYNRIARRSAPHYTTSLDAAIALMPAGHDIKITQASGPHRTDWYARCQKRDEYGSAPCHRSNASTEPLARCAAALRARKAQP